MPIWKQPIAACRETYRLTIAAYSVDITAEGDLYYEQFASCCKLAKATKVVAMTMPAAELGTPFNAEIERLRRLVAIATYESVLFGMKTETGRLTQDPDTAVVLCDNVKGLGITLDPSHYIYGPHAGGSYDQLMKHVVHVQLRDTTKRHLQVRVGQGQVEYGRLVTQLAKVHYNRALSVHITACPKSTTTPSSARCGCCWRVSYNYRGSDCQRNNGCVAARQPGSAHH